MTYRRRTLAADVPFEGVGLHSGEPVRVVVHPGEQGIAFRSGSERIEARPQNVTDTTRCTRVGTVATVEHLMSALAGLEITDAEIELDAGELPGLDGSAAPFYRGLAAAGTAELDEREVSGLFSRLFCQEEGGPKLAAAKGTGHWRFVYDLGPRWPHAQSFDCTDIVGCYAEQVAPARTLVLSEEIPTVQALGLGKGLDEDSVLIVGLEGYVNAPRFPDEPARHKLLDLVGDLALAGVPIRMLNVVAERSGHRANVQFAQMVYEAVNGK